MVDSDIAPLMHKLCMVEGEHFVAFSRANIATRIKAVLHPDMREEINRIRKNGHDLVRRAHTTTQRAFQLDRMSRCISAILRDSPSSTGSLAKATQLCAVWKFDASGIKSFLSGRIVEYLDDKSQRSWLTLHKRHRGGGRHKFLLMTTR